MECINLRLAAPNLAHLTRSGQKMNLLREWNEVGERIANPSHEAAQSMLSRNEAKMSFRINMVFLEKDQSHDVYDNTGFNL